MNGLPEIDAALLTAENICGRYRIVSLDPFLASCRSFAAQNVLNTAVFGRFKAGKSTFLNHILGVAVLPSGVIPVTAVITELEYGPVPHAQVFHHDGRTDTVAVERIGEFISESENPENFKHVARVRVELPSLKRYKGIRFVDTPGLESVLEHNTGASLEWLPNVGLAIVAVAVDPPLSQRDIELLQTLSRYTPNISLLLTKFDLLDEDGRAEVLEYVGKQLALRVENPVKVYPYSIRPGFESLRAAVEQGLLLPARDELLTHRFEILRHKATSLLAECSDYLTVALKSAEASDAERAALRRKIAGGNDTLEDARQALRLIARHAAGGCRETFERLLKKDEAAIRRRLLAELREQFPSWTRNFASALEHFDEWLAASLIREMQALSSAHLAGFAEPVRRAARQLSQSLQDFRNRLSERTLQALGVPLRTREMDLPIEEPRSPDVRVGKIFDRNWELLSPILPMPLIRGFIERHFEAKVADAVFMNLSRLTTQWDEIVRSSIQTMEKEALRRLDGLALTISRLTESTGAEAAAIQEDLAELARHRTALESLQTTPHPATDPR
jgi:GTP-binding protein EngB required for normal cell division